jgi:arylsulfatase A-like enzyme/thioredoxin-like negative regulator of GroEL
MSFWKFLLVLLPLCFSHSLHAAPAPNVNVILITLDTTRADRTGFLGSKLGLTPNLDALAQDSVVFERAYSQEPLTSPSHAVILTGTYPQFNHVADLGAPLEKDVPYLPDLFHHRGYRTAAFVGAYILDPKSAAPGFDRGFDTYDAAFRRRKPGEDRYKSVERRAGDVVDRAVEWLSKHPQGPFFLWLHFYDAHDPYDPPEPFKSRFPRLYDGEIAYADSQVGRFLTNLRTRGLYRGAMIAVMADHGEAFGEHGEERHGVFLYDETIHVPLLMKFPANRFAGNRVRDRVALADVAPTIVQVSGGAIPSAMQGTSLVSQIGDKGSSNGGERAIYSETDYARRAFGWSFLRTWRGGKYLYVQAPKRELYDQSVDPDASQNLAADSEAVADTLESQLDAFHDRTARAKGKLRKLDPEQAESLRALGYLASDANQTENDDKVAGDDPKDRIQIANSLHQALVDMEEDDFEAAIPKLQKVVEGESGASTGYLELGRALVHVKRYEEAVPVLRTAAAKMPESGMAHYELGLALVKTGQWEAALPEFQAAVVITPASVQLHFYLAAVLARLKRVPEASKEFEVTLKMDPHHFEANLLYGRMQFLEGHTRSALPLLQQATRIQPQSAQAHAFLADVYERLGQMTNAGRERDLAQRASGPGAAQP